MNNFKFTPGPWKIDGRSVCFERTSSNIKDVDLYSHQYKNKEEMQANARLIAAAPELFEILIGILEENRVKTSAIESGPNSILSAKISKAKKIIDKIIIP